MDSGRTKLEIIFIRGLQELTGSVESAVLISGLSFGGGSVTGGRAQGIYQDLRMTDERA